MINLEDEIVEVFDESLSKDEIVAKLLGWMRGTIRLKDVHMNQINSGIISKHLPHMPMLIFPVMEQLEALRHEAQEEACARILKLQEENADDALVALIDESDLANAEYIVLRSKAAQYRRDVEAEINKFETSAFEECSPYPERPDVPRYTTDSVEQWSLNKYSLSVIDFENSETFAKKFKRQSKQVEEIESLSLLKTTSRRHDALSSELEPILNEMQKPTPSKVMAVLRSRAGSQNTCVTTNDGEGVRWENNNGDVVVLNIKALGERIRTWRKHRPNTG